MISKTSSRASERGFTLIELAIVLVVIGVLIGAVLQGQALIESSRVKTTVAQVDSARAAVAAFSDRYNGLPGDFTNAADSFGGTNPSSAGAGNGRVGTDLGNFATTVPAYTATTAAATETSENVLFWQHLATAGMISGAGGTSTNTTGDGSVWLRAKLPSTAFIPVNVNYAGNAAGLWFALGSVSATSALQAGVARQISADIDSRYDDGLPHTGLIRAPSVDGCATATAYAGTGQCALLFRSSN